MVIDGKNPIVAHEYIGKDVKNKDIILVDDMIASGSSMLEVASELKRRGANDIYLFSTFALFTSGIEDFEEAVKKGEIKKLYTTNLSYIPSAVEKKKWFVEVDFSGFVADIIYTLYNQQSISPLMNGKEHILEKLSNIIND